MSWQLRRCFTGSSSTGEPHILADGERSQYKRPTWLLLLSDKQGDRNPSLSLRCC